MGPAGLLEAEVLLRELAGSFAITESDLTEYAGPTADDRYRALVEQIPAVVFMADLEHGAGQAYVSPQIEEALGFSQAEWLEDPIRWYQQVHPADKDRWSVEAADLMLSGKPLSSSYRVLSRDGREVWFQCEARMLRRPNGLPWMIHGIGFDITELKRTQEDLRGERNVVAGILDTVGSLVVVLDPQMRIVRFNRMAEKTSGYSSADVRGRYLWDLFPVPDQAQIFQAALDALRAGKPAPEFESEWDSGASGRLHIAWAFTALRDASGAIQYFIATGADVTTRKRLEGALLEVGRQEQRRIGQDLHDGLGQVLTGIAFMCKVHHQNLSERSMPEAAAAAKIVDLVNGAIRTTRDLSRGLMPIAAEPAGLVNALEQLAVEIENIFGVTCTMRGGVMVHDPVAANHLYHIAREAIHNGIKHGKAREIEVVLTARDGQGLLTIRDSGGGFRMSTEEGSGMGLAIMQHRAGIIGGSLEIASSDRSTTVSCHFPVKGGEDAGGKNSTQEPER